MPHQKSCLRVCLDRRSNRLPHGSQCLSTLLHRYAAYCGVSTSGVERTFSAMDQTVGKYRNHLQVPAPKFVYKIQLIVVQLFSASRRLIPSEYLIPDI